jgi:cephamycin C biosynthesis protein
MNARYSYQGGGAMHDDFRRDFPDLNLFRGVGEDPVYHPPVLKDRPRAWPLDRWADAPRDLGFDDVPQYHWRGLRLLKDPPTQSAYHSLLWELRPRTIIELGIYSGGSLVWFRDLTKLMGIDCQVVGADRNLVRCQIPPSEMSNIALHEADCANLESLEPLRADARHPLVLIDDMIPFWHRYSPNLLVEYLAAFKDVLTMDMVYANSCPQLYRGVFRRSGPGGSGK